MNENACVTTHHLDFEAAQWEYSAEFTRFRIGTCNGLWQSTDKEYIILAVLNDKPGNGHFEDVMQWFEFSCKRDKKNLMFAAIMNPRFADHLEKKRGFKINGENAVKKF